MAEAYSGQKDDVVLVELLLFVLETRRSSISHRVQRLEKYRFLKKQSDLLLNADDLDAVWVCLRENCVIDNATGAEKMCYVR